MNLEQILVGIESFRVERTESLNDTEKFCKAICAFANDMPGSGEPGYLLIGVDKHGNSTGATINEQLLERLAQLRDNGQTTPIPSMNVSKEIHQGKDIAVVEVYPSQMPPVRYKETIWIRTGPSADRATKEQEIRLEERRVDRATTWDLRACRETTVEDLALELFSQTYLPAAVSAEALAENGRTVEQQLGSLRMFDRKFQCPTNAAVLLFGKDPLAIVPGAYIQYVQYNGTAVSDEVVREMRYSGDMLNVLRDLDKLARSVENKKPVRQDDLTEKMIGDYPAVALHELFVNAVVHRKYDNSTTPISVNHFSDRIEIQNPGALYGDLTQSLFPDGTAYRNPILAEAAKILGFANRFGRGIRLAISILAANGSPPLEYEIGENHLAMIVRKTR